MKKIIFFILIIFQSLIFADISFSNSYSPDADIDDTNRSYTPTVECYSRVYSTFEGGYSYECFDVNDESTGTFNVVTDDISNTVATTNEGVDDDGNSITYRLDSDNYYMNKNDVHYISDDMEDTYNYSNSYYSSFSTDNIVSSTDIGDIVVPNSGIFDKAIAMNTNQTFYQTYMNTVYLNTISRLTESNNKLMSLMNANIDNVNTNIVQNSALISETNSRLESVAGSSLGSAINTRQIAYNTHQILLKATDLVNKFDSNGSGGGSSPVLPSDSNASNSLDAYNAQEQNSSNSYKKTITDVSKKFDDVAKSIENVKQTFSDSLATIEDLKNNDLTVRSGVLVDTNVNVFGQDVHFNMYDSFSVFKPIGTFIFTLFFFYLILSSSIRILVQGK